MTTMKTAGAMSDRASETLVDILDIPQFHPNSAEAREYVRYARTEIADAWTASSLTGTAEMLEQAQAYVVTALEFEAGYPDSNVKAVRQMISAHGDLELAADLAIRHSHLV